MSCLVDFERNLQSPAGLVYLPHIVCFPIHLQFPLFWPPLTSKKETCLLLITVLLTSLSARFFSALLLMLPFHMLLLFFSASHTQTSNRKLRIVSHVRTLCVCLQSRWTQNTAGYSTDRERKNQHSFNNDGLSAPHLRWQEQYSFSPNSRRGVKAFGLKALNN